MAMSSAQATSVHQTIIVHKHSDDCACSCCSSFFVSCFLSPLFGICLFPCFSAGRGRSGVLIGTGIGGSFTGIILIGIGSVYKSNCFGFTYCINYYTNVLITPGAVILSIGIITAIAVSIMLRFSCEISFLL